MGVFGYITDLKTVSIEKYADVEVTGGDDESSMLFRFLDDVLFLFNAEPFLIPKVSLNSITHTVQFSFFLQRKSKYWK